MDNEEQRDHEEETYNRELMRSEGVDVRPRTAAAIAANVRRGLDRKASELRAAGFTVYAPEVGHQCDERYAAGVERHEFTRCGHPVGERCALCEVDAPRGESRPGYTDRWGGPPSVRRTTTP